MQKILCHFSIYVQGEGAAGDGHTGGAREAEINPGEGEGRLCAELQRQVRRAAAVPALPQDVRVQNAHEGKQVCEVVLLQKQLFRSDNEAVQDDPSSLRLYFVDITFELDHVAQLACRVTR